MNIRILEEGDEARLERFLQEHADSSMILRSNLRLAGVVDHGARHQATYAAAVRGESVIGVVAHYWNGNLIPQAPIELMPQLAAAALEASGRELKALVGASDQVVAAVEGLGLGTFDKQLDSEEGLYALQLRSLRRPGVLDDTHVAARKVLPEDRAFLVDWFSAYSIETLGAHEGRELRDESEQRFEQHLQERLGCLLLHGGRPVSFSSFNAQLPDAVQVGGVFTPPAERCRGFARGAVAHSLLEARARGVERAVLFTDDGDIPAIRAYQALGFQRVGEFRITILA
ncbi:MAG: GNAT family N-acetyltransferase [Myxococcales bacterium]|nr:GNAT family N-acetyltransferase [Myxococcales bacterium]